MNKIRLHGSARGVYSAPSAFQIEASFKRVLCDSFGSGREDLTVLDGAPEWDAED